ncbi:cation:proton antiporter [Streptomyces sp. NBC_01235]|uniref:cation:proton antiporter n=1 Tax=Streptomyces sp. NBC_01235 TaxID=2903788 RepID=UPI002E110F11|nr:cation:proton antiporter [Streptomyces sp. NBC_01235]
MADAPPLESIVLADIAIVLLAGTAMVKLGKRLRQPPVVAEITVGLMLGPSLLGLLPGNIPHRLFPGEALPMLSVIAQVGLVLFMFLAGLELDVAVLRGDGKSVSTIAALSMAVPFGLGAGTAALLYGRYAPHAVSHAVFVLYMGTAFSITAFPVLARIIRDGGLSRTRIGTLAMACAAVCDVLAWCLLAVVVAVAQSDGIAQSASVIAWAAAYGVAMFLIVQPLLRRVVASLASHGDHGMLMITVVSGTFLSSCASAWIGIHAIFGAFVFGMVMPREALSGLLGQVAASVERVSGLFLPVFFIVTGLSVDIGALGWAGLSVLLLVVVTAVAGKFAGAAFPARLLGMSWREAGAFGALMNTRGLTEIVILEIGRELGLISGRMFTLMVLMALLTTVVASPMLRALRMWYPDSVPPVAGGVLPQPSRKGPDHVSEAGTSGRSTGHTADRPNP